MAYRLETNFGDLFAVSGNVSEPWANGDLVGLSFMGSVRFCCLRCEFCLKILTYKNWYSGAAFIHSALYNIAQPAQEWALGVVAT